MRSEIVPATDHNLYSIRQTVSKEQQDSNVFLSRQGLQDGSTELCDERSVLSRISTLIQTCLQAHTSSNINTVSEGKLGEGGLTDPASVRRQSVIFESQARSGL